MEKRMFEVNGKEIEFVSTEGKIWFVNKPEDVLKTGIFGGLTEREIKEKIWEQWGR